MVRLLLAMVVLAGSGCSHEITRPQHAISTYNAGNQPAVVHFAIQQVGTPYRYGGQNPGTGFDCSGLVYYAYQQAGYSIPRSSSAQYSSARHVSLQELQAGDLLFFRVSPLKVSHVGIYIGNGDFVHAPSSGKTVEISRLDNPYWRKRFITAGRIPGSNGIASAY